MLNFYSNPLSPYAQKVMFFLEQAKIPYQYHVLDLGKGDQAKPDFLKVNPFGVVPAIELNGFSMGESNAILRYLADRYALSSWYPSNLEDRARVDNLMEFCNLQVNRGLILMAWNLSMAPMLGRPVNKALIEEGQRLVTAYLPKLERYLDGRTYIAGPTMTLADANLLPFVAMHQGAHVSLADFPQVRRWYQQMSAQPGWVKTSGELQKLLARLKK